MGELEPWMDENFIKGVFLSAAGETVNVKVIRDKNSGYAYNRRERNETYAAANQNDHSNAGYCFVEFTNPDAATKALGLNGTPVPNSSRQFKLNWASGGGLVDRRYVVFLSLDRVFCFIFSVLPPVCRYTRARRPRYPLPLSCVAAVGRAIWDAAV